LEKATKTKDASKKLLDNLFGKPQQKTDTAGAPSKLGSAFGQKDPQRTTIGSGSSARLKVKDSIADIVAKQYLFMQKTYEEQKQEDELNVAFRKEQLEEDERRHKKLIDELIKFKKTAVPEKEKELTKEEEKDDGSWIQKMLGGIKNAFFSTLKGLFSIIMAPIKLLTSLITSLLGVVTKIALGLGEVILDVIAKSAEGIVKLLASPLVKLISAITGSAFSAAGNLIGTIGGQVVGMVSNFLPGWAKIATVLLASAGTYADYVNSVEKLQQGEDYQKLTDRQSEELATHSSAGKAVQNQTSEEKKSREEMLKRHQSEKNSAERKFHKETLIPKMQNDGWTANFRKDGALDGFSKLDEKGNEITPGMGDFKHALDGEHWKQKELMKFAFGQKKTFEEAAKDFMEEGSKQITNKIDPILEPFKKEFAEVKSTVENLATQTHSLIDTAKNETIPTLKNDFNAGREYAKSGDAVITTSNKIDNGKVTLNAPMQARNHYLDKIEVLPVH
jgi:hypothetical protein